MHVAEFNIGILRYDWDDPRVADFANNIELVNAIARRSKGFVWMMGEADMEAAQTDETGPLGGNPRAASTLSVWEDLASLERFVWNTVHKAFYDRRGEWYDDAEQGWNGQRFVMWAVPEGHRPSIAEAVARLEHLAQHGDSETAFGWAYARKQVA